MNQNYHKRLGNYLSQPKSGLYHSSSQHSYLTAAKTKFPNPPRNPPVSNLYKTRRQECPLCSPEQNRTRYECGHTKLTQYDQYQYQEGQMGSEYFVPEIKTIRNTLLDIRDQMRVRGRITGRKGFDAYAGDRDRDGDGEGFGDDWKLRERELRDRIQEKNRRNKELQAKIDQLQSQIQQLQQKTHSLQSQNQTLQSRLTQSTHETQQHRLRANRAQSQRNTVLQKQRSLQIKIMDLRADLMRKDQLLRDLNFNQEQQKYMENTKRLMLGPSEEVSMMVNWGNQGYRESRGAQTQLSEVDIEGGYRELNVMQDNLCDRINGNLKVEKKIFARIQEIDGKLGEAFETLYRVQQEAMRMGINVG